MIAIPLLCCSKCDDEIVKAYPNPFSESTTIKYIVLQSAFVKLDIYNSLGEKITTLVEKQQNDGVYEVVFVPENLPSGTYYLVLQVGKYLKSEEIILTN